MSSPVVGIQKLPNGQKAYVHKYGVVANAPIAVPNPPPGAEDLHLEFYCFRTGRTVEQGGLGKYGHFRKICSIVLPTLIWHEWLEDQIKSLCDDHYAKKINNKIQRHVTWAGCATAGKTFAAALYAFIWFLADPKNSIVVLTSTSAKMVRKRIWPVLSKFYIDVRDRLGSCGHMVDSKTTIQESRGNDLNAIFAMAVGEGETSKAAANIQGMHAPRIFVVIDEATDVQEAILVAIENLKTGCDDFTELYSGNAKSRMDPLGRAMEPKDGWTSITVDDDEWLTRNGICLHFDGFQSPNVKLKKTQWPFIFTYEDYLDAVERGDPNSIAFWMYKRGFPPPDGVTNTIFSEAMIDQHDGRGTYTFQSRRRYLAGLDPAFGGDKCVLTFAYHGDIEDGRNAIQLIGDKDERGLPGRIEINGDATSNKALDYQIAHRAIEECKRRGMLPSEVGVDATGIGRGVYAIICENWSDEVVQTEFGGAASDMPASFEDMRPGNEVYGNAVTEIWMEVRRFLETGQLRGLTPEVIKDFCAREYSYKGRRIFLESKGDCKKRIGRSPDDGDSVAVLINVARRLGITASGKAVAKRSENWQRIAAKYDAVYHQDYDTDDRRAVSTTTEMFGWMQ